MKILRVSQGELTIILNSFICLSLIFISLYFCRIQPIVQICWWKVILLNAAYLLQITS